MRDEKWYLKVIEDNVELSNGIKIIKERWGKMIGKIEDKKKVGTKWS